ncbi:MAG: T9SS type A sorting domain-containing protein [Bacteroidota bacterium]|nr:T9SS type A sorting domain-containing protein [Bacteroidota bacterium]
MLFKKIRLIYLFFIVITASFTTKGAVTVLGTGFNINNICPNDGNMISLPDFVIGETLSNDFQPGGSACSSFPCYANFVYAVPSGFEIQTEFVQYNFKSGGDISFIYQYPDYTLVTKNFIRVMCYFNGSSALDAFTISGIKIKAVSNFATGNVLFTDIPAYNYYGLINPTGFPSGSVIGTLSSANAGNIFGWNDKYCLNNGKDTINAFPTNGSFSISTLSSSITNLGNGNLEFNPKSFGSLSATGTSINVTLTYTYPGFGSCNTITRTAKISPVISVTSITLGQNSFPYGDGIAKQITVTGANLINSFGGPGVANNFFFADEVSIGGTNIFVYSTNTITGCSDTSSISVTVYDKNATFDFNPKPPLSILFGTSGTGSFCVNDPTTYNVVLNGLISQTPESYYSVSGCCAPPLNLTINDCKNSTSITLNAPSYSGSVSTGAGMSGGVYTLIGGNIYSIVGVKFTPSLAGVNTHQMYYNFGYTKNSTQAPGCFLNNHAIWKQQSIKVYAEPAAPTLNFTNSKSFCLGKVTSDVLGITTTLDGVSFNWYTAQSQTSKTLLFTSPGISSLVGYNVNLTSLGINNSTLPGIYQFGVSQVVNGCEGKLTLFTVTLVGIPSVPGISNLIASLPKFCSGSTYQLNLVPDNTISGAIYKWYNGPNTTTSTLTLVPVTTTGILQVSLSSTTGYYLTQEINGCSSNQIGGSTSGFNFVPIEFNPLPQSPTVLGSNTFCQFGAAPVLSVSGFDPTDYLIFDWYINSQTTVSASGTLFTITTPGVQFTNRINTGLSTNLSTTAGYYVKTRYANTGCSSASATNVSFEIVALPSLPQIINTNDSLYNNAPYCYNITLSSPISPSITGSSFVNLVNPTFEWRSPSSVSGIVSTAIGYNTGINTSIAGSTNFFIRQSTKGCFGPYKKLVVQISNPVVSPALINPVSYYCTGVSNSDIQNLKATNLNAGLSISWYLTATSSSPINNGSNELNPSIDDVNYNNTIAGIRTYFAKFSSFGCLSTLSSVNFEIRQTPQAPIVKDTAYCAGSYPLQLIRAKVPTLTNQSFYWTNFDNATYLGTNLVTQSGNSFSYFNSSLSANNFSQNTSLNFKVFQNVNGCDGPSSTLNVQIFQIPTAPFTTPDISRIVCSGNNLPIFTASSSEVNPKYTWFKDAALTQTVSSTNLLNTNILVTTLPSWISANTPPNFVKVYVTQTTNYFQSSNLTFNGCNSVAKIDSVILTPIPPSPISISPPSYCAGQVINPLTASGVSSLASINWYTTSLSGGISGIGNFYNTGLFSSSFITNKIIATYYVSQTFNTCESSLTGVTITINTLPGVSINGLSSTYCLYELVATITGLPSGGSLTSTISGFNSISSDVATFNPATASLSVSSQNVQYTYTNPVTGCSNSTSQSVQVYPTPQLSFQTLNTLGGYCAYPGLTIPLITSANVNGTGSLRMKSLTTNLPVNGINANNQLEPIRAGVDTFAISYTFTLSGSSCFNTITQYFSVHTVPSVSFSISSFCEGDSIKFTSNTTGVTSNQISKSTWKFTSIDTINAINITRKLFTGSYSTSFKVTTNKGCIAQKDSLYEVKPYPVPNFSWKFVCFGDSTTFKDKSTIGSGKIVSKIWNFGDSTLLSNRIISDTSTNQKFLYKKSGYYKVSLTTRSDKNCVSDTVFRVDILPYVSTFPKLFDFESSSEGWFTNGVNSDWVWGVPSKKYIKSQPATSKIWVTNIKDTIYTRGQDSYVNFPCMDFSSLNKPMISFDFKNITFTNIDGVVLQYSLDNGISWTNVGDVSTGFNWFNSNNIFGRPGSQIGLAKGWTGNSDTSLTWYNARNVLSNMAGVKKARLRFALGSTSNVNINKNQPLDGFAFDNVWIGDRTKIALLEQFTNGNDLNSANVFANISSAAPGLDQLLNNNQQNIIAIKYHTSFPESDVFNASNPSDPGTRALFYGVKNVPYTILDGNVYNGPSFNSNGDSLKVSALNIDISTLNVPGFNIYIQKSISGNKLSILSTISSNINISADSQLVFYIAVVERVVNNVTTKNGQTRFESVLKTMVPDAGGNTVSQSWTPGLSKTMSHSWDIKNLNTNNDQIGVVGFVQSAKSKKVLQAAYNGPLPAPSAVTEVKQIRTLSKNEEITIFPNPSNDEVTVLYNIEPEKHITYTLYDQIGNQINKGQMQQGKKSFKINTSNIPGGLYFLKLENGGIVQSVKKITVVH